MRIISDPASVLAGKVTTSLRITLLGYNYAGYSSLLTWSVECGVLSVECGVLSVEHQTAIVEMM